MFELVPLPLDEANAAVEKWHRHHQPLTFYKFALGAAVDGEIVGVAIISRPCARLLDNGATLEVSRVATNGHRNACSWLLARCWRACQALGYKRLITYTLPQEGGASLRGAGWRCVGKTGGGTWNRKGRPRVDKHPTQLKIRWEREC